MKELILLAAIIAGAYYYPHLNEDVPTNCQAVETKALAYLDASALGVLSNITQGEAGKSFAKNEYPNFPPQVGCSVLYWAMTLQKDKYKQAIRQWIAQ